MKYNIDRLIAFATNFDECSLLQAKLRRTVELNKDTDPFKLAVRLREAIKDTLEAPGMVSGGDVFYDLMGDVTEFYFEAQITHWEKEKNGTTANGFSMAIKPENGKFSVIEHGVCTNPWKICQCDEITSAITLSKLWEDHRVATGCRKEDNNHLTSVEGDKRELVP